MLPQAPGRPASRAVTCPGRRLARFCPTLSMPESARSYWAPHAQPPRARCLTQPEALCFTGFVQTGDGGCGLSGRRALRALLRPLTPAATCRLPPALPCTVVLLPQPPGRGWLCNAMQPHPHSAGVAWQARLRVRQLRPVPPPHPPRAHLSRPLLAPPTANYGVHPKCLPHCAV